MMQRCCALSCDAHSLCFVLEREGKALYPLTALSSLNYILNWRHCGAIVNQIVNVQALFLNHWNGLHAMSEACEGQILQRADWVGRACVLHSGPRWYFPVGCQLSGTGCLAPVGKSQLGTITTAERIQHPVTEQQPRIHTHEHGHIHANTCVQYTHNTIHIHHKRMTKRHKSTLFSYFPLASIFLFSVSLTRTHTQR